ncbi:MAG: hypothetical protein CSA35_06285 [Dethiosulfovibrio peptidovorans]|nr:MAG: hypothetical protein CSA35_06285 [Dethiosulfovibrio peptidovorans]
METITRHKKRLIQIGIVTLNLTLFFSVFSEPVQALHLNWATYQNARFGYDLEYPESLFGTPQESDNGDGWSSSSPDGAYRLRVFGGHNIMNDTAQSLLQEFLTYAKENGGTVEDIQSRGDEWFAVTFRSGESDRAVMCVVVNEDVTAQFELIYPDSEAKRLAPAIQRMTGNLTLARPPL